MNLFVKKISVDETKRFVSSRHANPGSGLYIFWENLEVIDLFGLKRQSKRRQAVSWRVFGPGSFCWLILLSCLPVEVVNGQQYQVTGELQTTSYDPQGKHINEFSSRFNVQVANNGWEITIYPDDKSFGDFNRISFDGTNMYALHDIETSVAKLQKTGAPVGKNLASGKVLPKEVPNDSFFDGVGQVWIAYASAGYFEKYKNGDLLEIPYYQMTGLPVSFAQTVKRRATWKTGGEEPKLPRSVFYLGERGDFTNAEFLAISYKTFEGLELPLSATFDIFYDPTSINKPKQQQVLRFRYLISALQFDKLENKPLFPPSVPVMTVVSDYQFNNSTDRIPIVLYWTDKRFLTKDEVQQLPKEAKNKLNAAPDFSVHRSSGSAINKSLAKWFLVAFISLNGIFLAYYMTRNKQK